MVSAFNIYPYGHCGYCVMRVSDCGGLSRCQRRWKKAVCKFITEKQPWNCARCTLNERQTQRDKKESFPKVELLIGQLGKDIRILKGCCDCGQS